MRTADVTLWVAVGLAAVAVIAVSLAGWQLVVARRQAQRTRTLAATVRDLSAATQNHARQATEADESARDQARWAWEQVKLANTQLEQAQQENRASAQAEQWEWAYALTMAARELVDTSTELVRAGLDTRVAPHYRQSAYRHYRLSCQRWQDTMIKALSRTSPSLEVQHQLIAFGYVHQRLHGHIDVLLRSAETGALSDQDPVAQSVHALRHELANTHRQFQRTVSNSLATVDETALHGAASADDAPADAAETVGADTATADAAADAGTRNIPDAAPATPPVDHAGTDAGAGRTVAHPTGAQHARAQQAATRQTAGRRNGHPRAAASASASSPPADASPAAASPAAASPAAASPAAASPAAASQPAGPAPSVSEQIATGAAITTSSAGARTAARRITGTGANPQRVTGTNHETGTPQGPPAKASPPQAWSA